MRIVGFLGQGGFLGGDMDHGSVFKRCGCRERVTGRLLGACCLRLRSARHGSWYFSADLPSAAGKRRRVRRGGFTTKAAAVRAPAALSSPVAGPTRRVQGGARGGRLAWPPGFAHSLTRPPGSRPPATFPG